MPISWLSNTDILQKQIDALKQESEEKRQAFLQQIEAKRVSIGQSSPQPQWILPQGGQTVSRQPHTLETVGSIPTPATSWAAPMQTDVQPTLAPQALRPQIPVSPAIETPKATQPVAKPLKEEEIDIPFWQRALQVFTAPFEWVDNYVIKPGLAVGATAVGAVEDVERLPGEDYFEWKKRSWEDWEAPGIDIDVPWSNDPWRVDMRGVLELAPWLLLPGAGGVGGVGGLGSRILGKTAAQIAGKAGLSLKAAAKAGLTNVKPSIGISGMLGKAGLPGRLLGTGIEYSPWGLTEKVAGQALKGAFKVAGGVTAKAGEKVFGKIVEPPMTPTVARFTKDLEEFVVPARKAFEKAKPTELTAKQGERLEVIASRYRRGEINATQRQALEDTALELGSLKAKFAVPVTKYTGKEMRELLDPIYKAAEGTFEAKEAARALKLLLTTGELPEPRHFIQFAKAYGRTTANALRSLTHQPLSSREKLLDLLNLPRAVLASGDLSGTFRQGLILALTHPTKFPLAFARQLKAFASEKLALDMDDVLRSHKLYQEAVSDGVEFTALRKGAQMVAKEEPFSSNIAQALPFIRKSERAFTTFLNEMRMGAYESSFAAMTAQGATKAERKIMGEFINLAGGRGKLPANLDKYAPIFNTVLFSAKYQMSTLQLPRQIGRMLLSDNPYMRKEAAKALVTFVGGGAALVSLLNATGKGKTSIDPRSGDFGKIVIGDTRLDIWRGYIQYVRFAAQLLTGERKSANGNINKEDRFNIAFRFLQGKASPAAGLMVDLLKGESYMGEPLFKETTGFIKTARDRLLPLAVQDTIDAMEQYGTNGLWAGLPAATGIGVLTYVNDLVRVKERIAREEGFESWDDIDPKKQREIQNRNVELQVAYLEMDRRVMGTAWGDWRNAGKAVEDTFRENVNMATAQYQSTSDGYKFRGKVADAFTARRGGYDARDKEDRFSDIVRRNNIGDDAEALAALGSEKLAIRTYNDALFGNDMYDEFGDYRWDEAEARKTILKEGLGELYEYVEEYQNMKYDDFPEEYKELARAKIVMKPYWAVQSNMERLFGKTFTESNAGQRLITKQHKMIRLSNREIEKYYQMFYAQN